MNIAWSLIGLCCFSSTSSVATFNSVFWKRSSSDTDVHFVLKRMTMLLLLSTWMVGFRMINSGIFLFRGGCTSCEHINNAIKFISKHKKEETLKTCLYEVTPHFQISNSFVVPSYFTFVIHRLKRGNDLSRKIPKMIKIIKTSPEIIPNRWKFHQLPISSKSNM